jgi:integrase
VRAARCRKSQELDKAAKIVTANTCAPVEELERMQRRRFQRPKPFIEGNFWYLRVWQNTPGTSRKRERIKLAEASKPEREVMKIAEKYLRPINQGLVSIGSGVNFNHFIEDTYTENYLVFRASTTQKVYRGMLRKYIRPALGTYSLGELTPLLLQRFFATIYKNGVSYPVILKTRDALSHVLRSAMKAGLIAENPLANVEMPPDKRGVVQKQWITPSDFARLLDLMPEPYATMVFVAVWTGLRVSELAALKWHCIQADSITIGRRYCRGDWSETKTKTSAATIAVDPVVIERIHRLKDLSVDVRAGNAIRHCKVVKSCEPDDLVFQSVYTGDPMNDGNILRRHIKPAATAIGVPFVNWLCLRRSCATWLVRAGADPKSVQGQMRHARISTTMDIYAQTVSEGQRDAVNRLRVYVAEAGPLTVQ